MKSYFALAAAAALATGLAHADTYQFDPVHTQVTFLANHMGFSTSSGRFHVSKGMLDFDGKDWSHAAVQVTIDTASLDMGDATWKEHLSSDKWLDVAKYPTITFKSTKVEKISDSQLKVTGDLTLHGVTKPVVLDTKVNKTGPHPFTKQPAAGFSATARLKRSDFGVSNMLPMIGDELEIKIEVEASVPKK